MTLLEYALILLCMRFRNPEKEMPNSNGKSVLLLIKDFFSIHKYLPYPLHESCNKCIICSLGKTNDEPEYNAALVESNGRIYCAIPVDHDATHPIENILKKKPNLPVQKDAKIVQYKPWDKQAKSIDRIALILMPLLFLMVSAIYWSTYLYIG